MAEFSLAAHTSELGLIGVRRAASATVPDNLKAGITKPCFYDPDINPTYSELAEHYATVVLDMDRTQ